MKQRILIAHGGGPTPVINSSLQGVIESALSSAEVEKVYAARFGVEGLLREDFIDLTEISSDEISKLSHTPATAIGSCRRKIHEEDFPVLFDIFVKYQITAFLYNGGNDSMDTCNKIHEMAKEKQLPLQVIGIPKTIDNDLAVTDHCPGFGSAAKYAALSASELALDASGLPIHVVVMEVMGRNAGWLTAATALAKRVTTVEQLILLPEVPFDEERFLTKVKEKFALGKGLLVTVSEGIQRADGSMIGDSGVKDGFGHVIPGGAAQALANLIITKTSLKARAEKPGLLGRTSMGYVSEVDRKEAYSVGKKAIDLLLEGKSGVMVTLKRKGNGKLYACECGTSSLANVANVEKKFPNAWIDINNYDIHDEFFEYLMPLMDNQVPDFANLRG